VGERITLTLLKVLTFLLLTPKKKKHTKEGKKRGNMGLPGGWPSDLLNNKGTLLKRPKSREWGEGGRRPLPRGE